VESGPAKISDDESRESLDIGMNTIRYERCWRGIDKTEWKWRFFECRPRAARSAAVLTPYCLTSLVTFPLGKDSSRCEIDMISTQSSIERLLDRRDILLASTSGYLSRGVSGV
jgi:hypothetical protein